jgi:hypothetical protein
MPIKSKINNVEEKTETSNILRKEGRGGGGGREKRRSKNRVKGRVIRS